MRKGIATIVTLLATAIAPASLRSENPPKRVDVDAKQNALPEEVKRVLNTAERFILLSLDPKPVVSKPSPKPSNETFHNYPVLRRTEIRRPKERSELLSSLYKGITESDGSIAMCFNPRHGIRAVRDGEIVDLVICFECLSIEIHGKTEAQVLTTASPASTFTRALKRAPSAAPKSTP